MPSQGTDPHLSDPGQQLQLLSQAARDYALITMDPRGIIVSSNAGAETAKGAGAEEIAGRHFSCFYAPEAVAKGKPEDDLRLAAEHGRFEATGTRLRQDGSSYRAAVIITPIRNADQAIVGFGEVTRDITEPTEHAAKLRSSEQTVLDSATRLRAVVDTALYGLILTDARGTIQMFNPACERLFGYAAEEVIGKNVRMLMPAPFQDQHDLHLSRYHDTAERKIIGFAREVVGRRKDGGTFPMDLSVGEAVQNGEVNFVGIIHDLTERKRVNEQLVQAQKMEVVGQLSGGIAHDFNNLLTVIIGNGDLLSEQLKPQPKLQELCAAIVSAGERGAELTQRLLAFSRRQTLLPVAIDCNRQVESMRQLLRRTLRSDIDIEVSLEPVLKAAFADPAQLESAILNLSLNAQDAMPGGGRLTITTSNARLDEHYRDNSQEVDPGEYVLISITDNGEGMSADARDRAFEPFFTTKEVGKGSGLGLSMVYGFIKQSNGHVSLTSEPGEGTTVRLYLPSAASLADRIPEPQPVIRKPQRTGSETVLIAEDDPFVLSYAATCLKSLGYTVITATDGNEALARLNQGAAPDVLFTDIVMSGGLNGTELAERACRIKPGLKILLTSGYAPEALTAAGRLDANTVVLGKPYRKSELAHSLRRTLDAAA